MELTEQSREILVWMAVGGAFSFIIIATGYMIRRWSENQFR